METETGRIDALAGRLLDKVEQAIGELDLQTASRKVKTKSGSTEETWEYREVLHTGAVDRAGLKLLTDLLKELQAITGGVPELVEAVRKYYAALDIHYTADEILITTGGSVDSHTAQILLQCGIPAMVGADMSEDWEGVTALMDGHTGRIYLNPTVELMEQLRDAIGEKLVAGDVVVLCGSLQN